MLSIGCYDLLSLQCIDVAECWSKKNNALAWLETLEGLYSIIRSKRSKICLTSPYVRMAWCRNNLEILVCLRYSSMKKFYVLAYWKKGKWRVLHSIYTVQILVLVLIQKLLLTFLFCSVYGEPIPVKELAARVASYVHLCTLYWWLRFWNIYPYITLMTHIHIYIA